LVEQVFNLFRIITIFHNSFFVKPDSRYERSLAKLR